MWGAGGGGVKDCGKLPRKWMFQRGKRLLLETASQECQSVSLTNLRYPLEGTPPSLPKSHSRNASVSGEGPPGHRPAAGGREMLSAAMDVEPCWVGEGGVYACLPEAQQTSPGIPSEARASSFPPLWVASWSRELGFFSPFLIE